MMFKFLKIIGVGYLLSVSTLANATFIDNGAYTTDTGSGLDWLDWTETINATQTEALDEFSDKGWRPATLVEADGLMQDFFAGATSPGSTIDGTDIPDWPQISTNFAQLFGVTYIGPFGQYTFALSGNNVYGIDGPGGIVYDGVAGYGPSLSVGVALVRTTTVSEPAIIALFALGFVGIGFARRRRS
jgi:hypothetical protein